MSRSYKGIYGYATGHAWGAPSIRIERTGDLVTSVKADERFQELASLAAAQVEEEQGVELEVFVDLD